MTGPHVVTTIRRLADDHVEEARLPLGDGWPSSAAVLVIVKTFRGDVQLDQSVVPVVGPVVAIEISGGGLDRATLQLAVPTAGTVVEPPVEVRFPPLRFAPPRVLAPRPAVATVATLPGPIRAYRCWLVDWDPFGEAAYLRSIYRDVRWPGPVLAADAPPGATLRQVVTLEQYAGSRASEFFDVRYRPDDGTVEVETLDYHGIYALKTPDLLELRGRWGYQGGSIMSGQVRLFGRVVEHERGYRAERALIEALTFHGWFREGEVPRPPTVDELVVWRRVRPLLERRYQVEVREEIL